MCSPKLGTQKLECVRHKPYDGSMYIGITTYYTYIHHRKIHHVWKANKSTQSTWIHYGLGAHGMAANQFAANQYVAQTPPMSTELDFPLKSLTLNRGLDQGGLIQGDFPKIPSEKCNR